MRTPKKYTLITFFDINNCTTGVFGTKEAAVRDANAALTSRSTEPLMFFIAEGAVTALKVQREPVVMLPDAEPKPRKPRTVAAKPKSGKQLRKEIETKVGKELDAS